MGRKIFLIALLMAVLFGTAGGGSTIPVDIKGTLGFIFVEDAQGDMDPVGTGFFVGVPDEQRRGQYHIYFVTAKHLLHGPDGSLLEEVYIRLDRQDALPQAERLELRTGKAGNVFFHPDGNADIAVIPMLPDRKKYSFRFLPDERILTGALFERLKVQEGDEIFYAGLFPGYFGHRRNSPVVRFGRVAMIPPEKIEWGAVSKEAYIVESSSSADHPGSPVFLRVDASRLPGRATSRGSHFFLAGVMKGLFQPGDKPGKEDSPSTVLSSDMGLSAVAPAYKLKEILYSEKLRALRATSREVTTQI